MQVRHGSSACSKTGTDGTTLVIPQPVRWGPDYLAAVRGQRKMAGCNAQPAGSADVSKLRPDHAVGVWGGFLKMFHMLGVGGRSRRKSPKVILPASV